MCMRRDDKRRRIVAITILHMLQYYHFNFNLFSSLCKLRFTEVHIIMNAQCSQSFIVLSSLLV